MAQSLNIISIQYLECLDWLISILTHDLSQLGWEVEYFRNSEEYLKISKRHHDNPLWTTLVFCPWYLLDVIQKMDNYIYWNLEQNADGKLSQHFQHVPDLDRFLGRAKLLLDYNSVNVGVWNRLKGLHFGCMPIPVDLLKQMSDTYPDDNDLLFIGCMNDRRSGLLPSDTYVPSRPLYGWELCELFDRSKVLLNIHFYEGAILERPRLNEALSNGIRIVSEYPCDLDHDGLIDYGKVINFTHDIKGTVKKVLEKYDDERETQRWLLEVSKMLQGIRSQYLKCLEHYFKLPVVPKLAVIQINYGNYEDTPQRLDHLKNSNLIDWYYVTDEEKEGTDQWVVKVVDMPLNDVPIRINKARTQSRYIKYRSCELDFLQDYDYVLYLDGNVQIQMSDFPAQILKLLADHPSETFFSYYHYYRNSIYHEMDLCLTLDKYKDEDLRGQVLEYHRHGHSYKLYECGIFMYKMCPAVKRFFLDWYREFVYWGTQDQLSIDYCFRKHGITPFILNERQWKLKDLRGSIWVNRLFGTIKPHKGEDEVVDV